MQASQKQDGPPRPVVDAVPSPSSKRSRAASAQGESSSSSRSSPGVIQPASFIDTLAILTLFVRFPSVVMVAVYVVFIATGFPGASSGSSSSSGGSKYASGGAGGPFSADGFEIPQKRRWMLLKMFSVDFAIAITTLYLTPVLRNLVIVFAHAVVAAYLGGGGAQKVFTNAVYSTTIVEILRLVWYHVTGYFFTDHFDMLLGDSGGSIAAPGAGGDAMAFDQLFRDARGKMQFESDYLVGDQQFNTLTTTWTMIPTVIRTLRYVDWAYEIPLVCFQVLAIHVIGQGLIPALKKIFLDKTTLQTSSASASSGGGYTDHDGYEASEPAMKGGDWLHQHSTVISYPGESAESVSATPIAHSDLNILTPAKKNKKFASVRAGQPLWSTLASSMVMAARQESLAATEDASQEPASDMCQFFVRFVFENAVVFEVEGFDHSTGDAKNFIVRVNGIQWPQVSLQSEGQPPESEFVGVDREPFLVVVHGLTPITPYEIETAYDKAVLMRVNVCTSARSKNHQSSGGAMAAPVRALSPVTTLLDTLTTAQTNLSEEKSHIKKNRKEYAKRLAVLRTDIDSLRGKLETSDKGDERNRRKVLSLRESVKQFEVEIEELEAEIKALESRRESDEAQFKTQEEDFKHQLAEIRSQLKAEQVAQKEWNEKIAIVESELQALVAKRDKLLTKKSRLNGDPEKSEETDLFEEIKNEFSRREHIRQAKLERRAMVEQEFSNSIAKMEAYIEETKKRTHSIWVSLQQLGNSLTPSVSPG
ncbi:hypothetical protein TRVA0_057S00518 [Trichomonascus vanleenenianus]|uniref:Nnf2p n=1 Tax=Trichomonascus vanleenenianus TaxID=2268995 RepID=UPI003ECBA121